MISRTQIAQVLKVYEAQRTLKPENTRKAASSESTKDGVSLSFDSKDIEKIQELVKKLPDIREDVVARIAREVNSGTYRRDSREVAEKLLGRLVADKIR